MRTGSWSATRPERRGWVSRLVLKFFEIEARFPRDAAEFPAAAVTYVAEQVKVDPGELAAYRFSGRTIEYHRAQIRDVFGFREFTRADEDKLADWLADEVCPVELRESSYARRCWCDAELSGWSRRVVSSGSSARRGPRLSSGFATARWPGSGEHCARTTARTSRRESICWPS